MKKKLLTSYHKVVEINKFKNSCMIGLKIIIVSIILFTSIWPSTQLLVTSPKSDVFWDEIVFYGRRLAIS